MGPKGQSDINDGNKSGTIKQLKDLHGRLKLHIELDWGWQKLTKNKWYSEGEAVMPQIQTVMESFEMKKNIIPKFGAGVK